jgi:predicted site-specific integrase-resolvase
MEQTHPDSANSDRFAFYARMSGSAQSASSLNRQLAKIEAIVRRLGDPVVFVVFYARISSARS